MKQEEIEQLVLDVVTMTEDPNGKCVLCKNKTENPRINYCDECLENYNGIE